MLRSCNCYRGLVTLRGNKNTAGSAEGGAHVDCGRAKLFRIVTDRQEQFRGTVLVSGTAWHPPTKSAAPAAPRALPARPWASTCGTAARNGAGPSANWPGGSAG